jgi:hypothetical protein
MTQEEIRIHKEKLEREIKEFQKQIEHKRLDLKHLQLECSHPNQYSASCMGEPCGGCPDCGWSW